MCTTSTVGVLSLAKDNTNPAEQFFFLLMTCTSVEGAILIIRVWEATKNLSRSFEEWGGQRPSYQRERECSRNKRCAVRDI